MKNLQPYQELFREDACPDPELITMYVKGTLSKENMRNMEIHLSDCELCSDTVDALQGGLITADQYLTLSEKIRTQVSEKSMSGAHAPNDNSKVIPLASHWKKYVSIAATIALLVTAFIFLQNRNSFNPSHSADQHFKPYEFSTLRGSASGAFDKGMEFYQKGDYRNALAALAEIETPKAQFFAGISAFACGQCNSAEDKLNKVVEANDSYAIDARWYLALTYMKTQDYQKAADLLDEFVAKDPKHQYADVAKQISEQLRNYKP